MNAERLRRPLFASGVLIGLMAEQLVLFAVPLILFQETRKVSTLGLAFALEWLPAMLAYPFAGLMADRDGGRRLFLRANGARAAILGCVALICLTTPSWSTGALMTNGAVLAALMALVRMSTEKMVPQMATGTDLPKTQALVQNMELLAMALGPGLAMVAVLVLAKVWLLGLAATMFALAGASWWILPRKKAAPAVTSVRANLAELRLGWSLLTGNKPVILLASLNFAINLAFATALSANAAVVTGVFKAPESSFALLTMCVGITGLVNLLLTPLLLKKFDVRLLGTVGFVLLSGSLLLLGLAPSFMVYAPAYVVALVGVAYFNIFNRTQRVKVIPREHLGKVMGPFFLLGVVSYPIGGLLVAGVGAAAPQRLVTVLAVLLGIFGAVVLPLTIRSFRRTLAARESVPVMADV
ncbi:MFS transporter [Kitasatospora sp. GP82]|uniref:MFS transporter n=1 Tax=Kitasatospora sp. GP82 TaxID=3035089 RepID=UPI0024752C8D|nr:MFS transporter [Kitasatospora sp. GP82]MDH6124633.1 MFS family permease [Kitasatospora sp. GP82]